LLRRELRVLFDQDDSRTRLHLLQMHGGGKTNQSTPDDNDVSRQTCHV
jgi:hypothetical protein